MKNKKTAAASQYAIQMKDDSYAPRHRKGQYVFVDPAVDVTADDLVVIYYSSKCKKSSGFCLARVVTSPALKLSGRGFNPYKATQTVSFQNINSGKPILKKQMTINSAHRIVGVYTDVKTAWALAA
jgi:hypothetical protein